MSIRIADPTQRLAAAALRASVLRPAGPLPGDEAIDDRSLVVVAVSGDGRVVGTATVTAAPWPRPELVPLPAARQVSGVAVAPDVQGSGIGTRLLLDLPRLGDLAEARPLWAAARRRAVPLYERCGWRVVGEPWHKPGVGPHRWVVLDRGEAKSTDAAAPARDH